MSKGKAAKLLREITRSKANQIYVCTVTSVLGAKCNAMPLDGTAEFTDVRLNAVTSSSAGIIITPAVDSIVVVNQISTVDSYISQFSEIEKIEIEIGDFKIVLNGNEMTFNDGTYGLVKIDKMVEWMQKVSTDLTTLQTQLSEHLVAGNGVPLGLVFNPTAASPSISQFEDEKIKH